MSALMPSGAATAVMMLDEEEEPRRLTPCSHEGRPVGPGWRADCLHEKEKTGFKSLLRTRFGHLEIYNWYIGKDRRRRLHNHKYAFRRTSPGTDG